jgi:hypothetical protein
VERLTSDLAHSGSDIRSFTHSQLPILITQVDSTIMGIQDIVADVQAVGIQHTILSLDTTINVINSALSSTTGTLGLLLNDNTLHKNLNVALQNIDSAVLNMDTILMSIKARPFIQKKLPKK